MTEGCTIQAGIISVPWVSAITDWPMQEMSSRGGKKSILVGVIIGSVSGAAVTLSVLSENSSSLVGVAISAALLPPMVNAGLSWGVAALLPVVKCALPLAMRHHAAAAARAKHMHRASAAVCARATLLSAHDANTYACACRVTTRW
jgi:hypothetical protein